MARGAGQRTTTMTTAQTISYSQIRSLRDEALRAGDDVQAVICDIALEGSVDMDDYSIDASPAKIAMLRAMTRDEAYAACADALDYAAAQE